MFPPVKGSLQGLNSSKVANSIHSTLDPFKNIEPNKTKAQILRQITQTTEGKESILNEIHNMRLKVFED
jgi:hypothetical protein